MVNRLRMPVPPPGSGGDCRCPIHDNAYGDGVNGQYWIRDDCPIHGASAAPGTTKEGESGQGQGQDYFRSANGAAMPRETK